MHRHPDSPMMAFERTLGEWLTNARRRASPTQRELRLYRQANEAFNDWLIANDLRMDAENGGIIVAGFLLSLVAEGASLREVEVAADGVAYFIARRRQFLDVAPIDAAVAMAAAQLEPCRVLN